MKKWYKSKTIWFNVAAAMGAAIEASLYVIQGNMRPEYFLALTAFTAGGNVVLRVISRQRITR